MSSHAHAPGLDPIVDWQVLVEFDDPVKEPTRARYRRLLEQALVSPGVATHRRRGTRLNGSGRQHSVLSALAVFARQSDHLELADHLVASARAIESRYAPCLEEVAREDNGRPLSAFDFYADLVSDTDRALDVWRQSDLFLAVVVLSRWAADRVEVVDGQGRDQKVWDLPRGLFPDDAALGRHFWIFQRYAGRSGVITQLLPGVQVSPELAFDEADALRRMDAGPSAGLAPEELNDVVARARARKPRVIRLVG